MHKIMPKRKLTLHAICALLLATLFVAGQTFYAAAATHGPCYLKVVTSKHAHAGSTGHHSTLRGGCCCDRSAPCDCDFNQGRNTEGSALPVTAVINSTSPTSPNPGVIKTDVTEVPYSLDKVLSLSWTRARAPSEISFPDTTKLTC
jgi:hypothetical protein